MKPKTTLAIVAICFSTLMSPEHTFSQGLKTLSAYLCETYGDFKIDTKFMPVKYLNTLFSVDVSSQEAWRIDSLYSYGDTIYYLGTDFKDFVAYSSLTQKEADEMMNALKKNAQKSKADQLECPSPNARPYFDDTMISFAQPVFTKDRTKCLVNYELSSNINLDGGHTPTRETLLLKFENGKWIDMHFISINIKQIGDK